MRKNKFLLIGVTALILVTVAVAAIHLSTRETVSQGALRVESGEAVEELFPEQLSLVPVQGQVVNGKGETLAVDAQGILLADLLAQAEMSAVEAVQVMADDAYSAAVTAEEVSAPDRVYLIRQEEAWQLVVFGDKDSKRNVRDVVRLVVS